MKEDTPKERTRKELAESIQRKRASGESLDLEEQALVEDEQEADRRDLNDPYPRHKRKKEFS